MVQQAAPVQPAEPVTDVRGPVEMPEIPGPEPQPLVVQSDRRTLDPLTAGTREHGSGPYWEDLGVRRTLADSPAC